MLTITDGPAPRKRGRPPKSLKVSESPVPQPSPGQALTPQSAQNISQPSPSQASPSKTPTKAVKALPTVRDHTSAELAETGDEYIPREFDQDGEKKVAPNGAPLGGRQYKCRTFFMPNRGDKLFMLATECAKVLQYRDSYLLFNKNRSLFKIIANQEEKNDLIQQDILPSSYRSRQIAVVTARSMYRQFGARLIVNGRRVRDDYWESKAKKQGFTEEDLAGEKRPGMAKQREAAAAAAAAHPDFSQVQTNQIIYRDDGNRPSTEEPLEPPTGNFNFGNFGSVSSVGSIPRPRHEITGVAYQDRTAPSGPAEMMGHATHTAEFNSQIRSQGRARANYMEELWHRQHEPPPAVQPPEGEVAGMSQALHSPRVTSAGGPVMAGQMQQAHAPQQHHAMLPPQYSPAMHQTMLGQSPNRPTPQSIPQGQRHMSAGGMPMGAGGYPQYGFPAPGAQVWGTAGPSQPSPLSQAPMGYGQQHVQHASPHMAGPQALHHPGMQAGPMQNMAAYGGNPAAYGRQPMYANAPGQQGQAYMPNPGHGGAGSQPGGMQNWPATTGAGGQPQQWGGGF
jgi:hypothetical protein